MTTRTRSEIGRANARKGKDTERKVAGYLRDVGFPGAERAVRTGYRTAARDVADPGDITGTPGIVWQVKDCAREQIDDWLSEAEDQAVATGADLGVLVVRRRGHADPARWWAWLTLNDVGLLLPGRQLIPLRQARFPVRMELGHLVPMLHTAGYGSSEEAAA